MVTWNSIQFPVPWDLASPEGISDFLRWKNRGCNKMQCLASGRGWLLSICFNRQEEESLFSIRSEFGPPTLRLSLNHRAWEQRYDTKGPGNKQLSEGSLLCLNVILKDGVISKSQMIPARKTKHKSVYLLQTSLQLDDGWSSTLTWEIHTDTCPNNRIRTRSGQITRFLFLRISLEHCHNFIKMRMWELHIAVFENCRSLATDQMGIFIHCYFNSWNLNE